ncbi:MAG TPA: N-acetylmuramoyl-L-alanine amidase [Candidatus Baltobacteraceae bacterium]|nr:N-acetylmuramoyl-L-alanine amidase [Candidatus Baltobacteraceae bacterium]
MNWIRRFAAPIGSALALLICLQLSPIAARADSATYVFRDQPITFSHLAANGASTMVGINDPGLRQLLHDLGAVVTWHPGERYVLITTAEPVVINFSVGDSRYDVGPLSAQASVAPYAGRNDEVYLPLNELLGALYLAPKHEGNSTVLQPQLASIDVQGGGTQAVLVARGGTPLHARVVSEASDKIVYEFDGVGSTLAHSRSVNAGGVRSLEITTSGTARAPKTLLTVLLEPGARHDGIRSNSGDFEVAFGGNGGAPPLLAANAAPPTQAPPSQPASEPQGGPSAMPEPQNSPAPQQSGASVTGVTVTPSSDGATVTIAVSGNANYEWHRLREPDNRFWIDIDGAQLQGPAQEEAEADPLTSLRVRQNDAQTVRVALSFTGAKALAVSPSANGIIITVGRQEVADAPRAGSGTTGSLVAVNEPQTLVTPVPADQYGMNPPAGSTDWKFGPRGAGYVATNPKLIVIDPGHGGSDPGIMRNGIAEKDLALDMANRLRDILVARGWQVKMTRNTDVDVYAPNDSARDELQARVNVANNAGARMFVSIHVNGFINSGPNGTTTYYSKPIDVPLAQSVERDLASNLGTKDDGTVKSHLYVTLHSFMPAVLVETAFLSNPSDYARLTSPDWRQKVAQSIADGIDQYAQNNPASGAGGQ